ncbi:MAG: histidine kinase [Bacteroidota bacterium]
MKTAYFNTHPFGRFLRNLIGSMVLALIVSAFTYNYSAKSLEAFLITYAWALAVCYTQWIGHTYFFNLLDKKFSWQKQPIKRAFYGSLAIIIYAVIAYVVVTLIMTWLVYGELPEDSIRWGIKSSYVAIFVSFAVSIGFLAIGFFQSWKNSLLETERVKAEMLMYKYEALQNQINPHFLFNSFNVLSDLVYEDQKKAVTFIKQMSQLFRYVLDSRDKELVPVNEELEFVSSYAYLLQSRFEDKLSFDISLDVEADEMMVPMTLQFLVENCVKHNEISASRPLSIKIYRDKTAFYVENTLQLKKAGDTSTGTGLSNMVQQYSYFTDRQIMIHETDLSYSVEVPILKAGEQ